MITHHNEEIVVNEYIKGTPIEKIYNIGVGHETMYKLLDKHSIPRRVIQSEHCPTQHDAVGRGIRIVYSKDPKEIGDEFDGGFIISRFRMSSCYEYKIQAYPVIN